MEIRYNRILTKLKCKQRKIFLKKTIFRTLKLVDTLILSKTNITFSLTDGSISNRWYWKANSIFHLVSKFEFHS